MSIRNKVISYAYSKASSFRLNTDSINMLSDIALCALGLDLFEKPFFHKAPITRESEITHPLVNALYAENSIDFGVIELLELGLYLKELSSDPNIHICINNLKNPKQYESTLLQLAFAYRLKIAGCEILLEPKTLRGKSDILFTYETKQYIAECYRINRSFLDFIGDFYSNLFKALMNYVPEGKKYTFKIRFQGQLSPENKVRILQTFKKMILKFNKDESISIEDDFENIYIGIEDITKIVPDPHFDVRGGDDVRRTGYADADACLCKTIVSAPSTFALSEAPLSDSTRMSRLFIWGKEEMELSSPLKILESKINNKLKQTKVEDSTVGRLLIVEMPFTRGFKKNNNKILEIQNRIVKLYKGISALVIIARRPSDRHRFIYEGPFVMGYSQYALPEKLIKRLGEIETTDILDNN